MSAERVRIHQLLEMLKSENASKRYDACEWLRVSSRLPEEAIAALRFATQDPVQSVADAAKLALEIHTPEPAPPQQFTKSNTESMEERKQATTPYTWLRWSPLLTIFTFIITYLSADLHYPLNLNFYEMALLAILVSSLWHFLLLINISNTRSEFVRWHGWQALMLAFIRTLTCLVFLSFDGISHNEGSVFFWVIPVLIVMWIVMTPWGKDQARSGKCALANWLGRKIVPLEDEPGSFMTHPQVSANLREPAMNPANQEVPARILMGLKSDESKDQLEAIHELKNLDFCSPEIMYELERLAAKELVHYAALEALDFKTVQEVRAATFNHLGPEERSTILAEIKDWRGRGLILPWEAEVLVRRYDFSRQPIEIAEPVEPEKSDTAKPIPIEPINQPSASTEDEIREPDGPTPPQPSLSQRLLSQTTINIALYLGAFLVIGAAAILAVLVEEARLPILLGATILFACGAIAIKRRLPQPSFTLFIVFSFLLPINAIVIAQDLHLAGSAASAYWSMVFILMALIWGINTVIYTSRLFSIASLVAFTLGAYRFGSIFNAPFEWTIFNTTFCAMIGLLGVHTLKSWKDREFALPLFLSAQILNGLALLVSIGLIINHPDDRFIPGGNFWLASTFTWIFAATFYAWSGRLYNYPFFAEITVIILLPISWLTLKVINASASTQIVGLEIWGIVFAFASEFFGRGTSDHDKEYYPSFLIGSFPLFFTAVLWAFAEHSRHTLPSAYAFWVLSGAAVVYAVLTVLRPRTPLWSAALIFGSGAYFTFFSLPILPSANIYLGYQLLGAGLLLLVPELFFKSSLTTAESWRWPPVALGALMITANIVLALADQFSDRIAIILGVDAILCAAYALHFRHPGIGYLATASAALSATYTLQYFNLQLETRFEILTALSVFYFIVGYILPINKRRAWGNMLRLSGLALGAILAFLSFTAMKEISGWHVLAISGLYFAETHISGDDRTEAGGPLFACIGCFLILHRSNITDPPILVLILSLLWLGSDLVYSRTLKQRRYANLIRLVGGAFAISNLPALLTYGYIQGYADRAALIFMVYVLFFAVYAWTNHEPMIGYASTGSLAFAILLTLQYFQHDLWLPSLTGLSGLLFLAGYLLRAGKNRNWGIMLRTSGLATGTALSFASLILMKPTGEWYIVIVGALFVFETYLRREDRLEISSPIFFSMAIFLGFYDFNITNAAYRLLAISLIWLAADLIFAKTLARRRFAVFTRLAGGTIAFGNAVFLISSIAGNQPAAINFGIYAVFFAIYAWCYRDARLGYIATSCLPLGAFFGLKTLHQENWLYAVMVIAILYYMAGFILRGVLKERPWSQMLLLSGLGLGVINSASAPLRIGLEAAIPVALAATLFAVEAFDRKNVWLGFPANLLYLESYILILAWLDVHQPQYYSIGTALVGMLMNYLLRRAGSRTGAFIMGMVSQLVLLGTTYIQMVVQLNLNFFFTLFIQSLAVLMYGIMMRSRSLVIAPISFTVLGVLSLIIYAMKSLGVVVTIGITGIALLLLGILAALMRERITTLTERFKDWQA